MRIEIEISAMTASMKRSLLMLMLLALSVAASAGKKKEGRSDEYSVFVFGDSVTDDGGPYGVWQLQVLAVVTAVGVRVRVRVLVCGFVCPGSPEMVLTAGWPAVSTSTGERCRCRGSEKRVESDRHHVCSAAVSFPMQRSVSDLH